MTASALTLLALLLSPTAAALPSAASTEGAFAAAASSAGERAEVLRLTTPLSAMVRIPAGTFVMGSEEADVLAAVADCTREAYGHRCTPASFSDELPQHVVQLSSYWIDRFEVRVSDYERCVRVGRCGPRPTSEATRRFDHPDLPVSRVTWNDARAYCEFRGLRLPTEAEFERAARGVSGRRYPWGELFNSRASNQGRFGWDVTDDGDGFAELAPVGSFGSGVTPEGVYDLAGNVAEWVNDRYAPSYEAGPSRDPRGPAVGASNLRVVRGGSYAHASFRSRGAARAFAEPNERRTTIGFRCVRSASGSRGSDGSGEAGAPGPAS